MKNADGSIQQRSTERQIHLREDGIVRIAMSPEGEPILVCEVSPMPDGFLQAVEKYLPPEIEEEVLRATDRALLVNSFRHSIR